MTRILAGALAGFVFGLGILVSGMSNPAKVLNFFDVAGIWDPSLAFVMGAGLAVTIVGYRLAFALGRPLLAPSFDLPTRKEIDWQLLLGSLLFGVGWGIAGFCPGGLIPVLGLGLADPWIFFAAMVVGIIATRTLQMTWQRPSTTNSPAST